MKRTKRKGEAVNETFYENIKTPVQFETEVAVAGGGIAGIAAALAAARHGKRSY